MPAPAADQQHYVFVYGTLADPGRLNMLLAPRVFTEPMVPAVLPGYRREECQYYYATPDSEAEIEGVLIGPFTDRELAQLDRYEGCPQLYTRAAVSVGNHPDNPWLAEGTTFACWVYVGEHFRACHEAHKEGRGALELCRRAR